VHNEYMVKHDWEKWRRFYVVGDDNVSLPSIASIPGAPSLPSLKRMCAAESWADQRKRFREQRDTVTVQDDATVSAVRKVERIIDSAEMLTRHAQLTKLMGAIAAHELQQLRRKQLAGEPTGLKPDDALKLARAAIADERLTEGLATQRQTIDLSSLTDEQLEKLANGD
jgi:hypothetical protein